MKICPKCQQQYPNGFQYCPNDTEFLLTSDEYVRRTKPLTSKPAAEPRPPQPLEAPIAEVVPIRKSVPEEQVTTPIKPIGTTPINVQEQNLRESAGQIPLRRGDVIQTAEEPPKPKVQPVNQHPPTAHQRPVHQTPAHQPLAHQPQARPTPGQANGGVPTPHAPQLPRTVARPQPPEAATLSFALPEESFFSRLSNAIKNIGDSFGKGAPPIKLGTAGDSQFLAEESFFSRFGSALKNIGDSFGKGAPPIKLGTAGDSQFLAEESFFSRLSNAIKNIGDSFGKSAPPMKPGATGDFRFLLVEESLVKRIGREIQNALNEFRRNPRQFVVDFIKGEGSNLSRRNALLGGSEMAFVGFVTAYFIIESLSSAGKANTWMIKGFFVGFAVYLAACYLARGFLLYKLINRATGKIAFPKVALEVFNWAPLVAVLLLSILLSNYDFYCKVFPGRCVPPEQQEEKLALVAPIIDTKMDLKLEESAKAKKESIGGSKPKPKPAQGGGGGGRQQPEPPSKGVPPQMALTPQIIPPNPEPPKIKNPSLIVASTIYGDPKAIPPMKGPIGDPTGVPAPPSSGPGTGDGIGRNKGTGVGSGEGGGLGPGRGGNTGGGDMAIGGGRSIEPMSGSLRPTILYKEKAKYTEEARQNKIQGTVVLNVVFTSDGRITNIRVIRGLPDGLTEKAIEAAQKIRFNPAVKNGSPVSVRGNLEFTFNLY